MKRPSYKLVEPKQYTINIKKDCCPVCATHKTMWKRRTDWKCCSTKCSKEYNTNAKWITWKMLRLSVFERDEFTCVHCGFVAPINKEVMTVDGLFKCPVKPESALIADHVIPFVIKPELYWNMDNLQTLCKTCNKTKTAKDMGKIAFERKAVNTKKLEV